MQIKSVAEADLKNKIVLIRTDFNVPIENGLIIDNTRILESVENIKFILERGAGKVVIVSHVGRPEGIISEELRLKPIAKELESLLSEDVEYQPSTINELSRKKILSLHRKVILLENIRFEAGEEKGDEKLAKKLAGLGDIFVLDGFSVAHRDHASVTKVAQLLPSYGGLGLIKEITKIDEFLGGIRSPFWGFFGGIKLSDKIPVIKALATKLDGIVFGSSIAIAYLKKYGFGVGDCIVSGDSDEAVENFMNFLEKMKIKIIYPEDLIVADVNTKTQKSVVSISIDDVIAGKIKPFAICETGEAIYDIGEKSILMNKKIIDQAGTIFWNGPFGFSEQPGFEKGSEKLAMDIIASKAISMVGGGDTVAFVNRLGISEKFKYVSTSGGAMMEYLAFGGLVGLENIEK